MLAVGVSTKSWRLWWVWHGGSDSALHCAVVAVCSNMWMRESQGHPCSCVRSYILSSTHPCSYSYLHCYLQLRLGCLSSHRITKIQTDQLNASYSHTSPTVNLIAQLWFFIFPWDKQPKINCMLLPVNETHILTYIHTYVCMYESRMYCEDSLMPMPRN